MVGTESGGGGASGGASGGISGGGGFTTLPATGGDSGGSPATGGASGAGGDGGTGGALATGGATGCSADGVPADVAALFSLRCLACHGNPPLAGVPASFATYTSLTAPSKSDPAKSNAALAVARMQNDAMPMPPAPLQRATTAEIATLQAWVAAGTPKADCGADGGTAPDAPPAFDPFAVAPKCTSGKTWTNGTHGSAQMQPGVACVNCHAMGGDGPRYAVAGTLYPTGHEPDQCDGVAGGGTAGAQVVIVGADGKSVTLTPNSAGNFFYQGTIAKPYLAKVTYMGRERAMIEAQTSGDCNLCHTQNGSMPSGTMKAPGRIVLP